MRDFEKYISENTEMFDSFEPSVGHFSKFKKRIGLSSTLNSWIHDGYFRAAASVVILFGIGFSMYVLNNKTVDRSMFVTQEYAETEQYYMSVIDIKINEIRDLIPSAADIEEVKEVSKDINEVEKSFTKEITDIGQGPNNEYVYSTMILAMQQKIEVLDNILTHLKNANTIIN